MSDFIKNKIDEIMSVIGTTNKFLVEFGIYDWHQDNTTRLVSNGWKGLWIEADKGRHYRVSAALKNPEVMFLRRFITAENINEIFAEGNVPQEFDFMSMDVDGMDYWLLKALTYRPRAFTVEYNGLARPPKLKVPAYKENYVWNQKSHHGSSLSSLVKLCKEKGYELISCDDVGVNCFFVQAELFPLFNIEDNSPETLFTKFKFPPWPDPGGPWLEI